MIETHDGPFNWGSAILYIDNKIWNKYGLHLLPDTIPDETIILDRDEHLIHDTTEDESITAYRSMIKNTIQKFLKNNPEDLPEIRLILEKDDSKPFNGYYNTNNIASSPIYLGLVNQRVASDHDSETELRMVNIEDSIFMDDDFDTHDEFEDAIVDFIYSKYKEQTYSNTPESVSSISKDEFNNLPNLKIPEITSEDECVIHDVECIGMGLCSENNIIVDILPTVHLTDGSIYRLPDELKDWTYGILSHAQNTTNTFPAKTKFGKKDNDYYIQPM
jgi:hypothetical protein